MAFNPDEFLAKVEEPPSTGSDGGGFDPDAFLAKKNGSPSGPVPGGPSAFMAGKGGGFDDIELAPTTTPIVRAGKYSAKNPDGTYVNPLYNVDPEEDMKHRQFGAALVETAKHPVDTLADPSKRREIERGVSDVTTLGLAEKAGNAVGRIVSKPIGPGDNQATRMLKQGSAALGFKPEENDLEATAAPDAAAAPGFRDVGQTAALPLPNLPGEVVGRGVSAGIKAGAKAANAVAKPIAKTIAKIGEGAEGRMTERAIEKTIEGGTKKTRGALEHAEQKLVEALDENKSLKIAALKGDKYLEAEGQRLGKRGAAELEEAYAAADRASEINPERPSAQITGDLHDVPAATRTSAAPAAKEPAALPAAMEGEPVVYDHARAYHLDQNAIAAETRAAKAEEALAREERRGMPVNPELRAKFERRQAVKEVAARELRDQADKLRAIADEAKATNVPPGGRSSMPEGVEYIPPPKAEAPAAPETPVADAQIKTPKRRPPGADLGNVVKNLDSRIESLAKPTSAGGSSESRAVADELKKIRDKFVLENQGGSRFSPAKFLRREMTAFQKKGFGKGMAGDEAATARIAANREASKAVGDVIIEHVTGMDYATAKAAAEADPTSVAAKLFKANRDVELSNLIESHLHAKQGQNPNWARNVLKYAKATAHAASGGLLGGLAHTGHGTLATVGGLVHAGVTAAPYVARGVDTVAEKALPAARKIAAEGLGIKAEGKLAIPVAKLLRAAKTGNFTRPQLQAMAKENGVPDDTAMKIADATGI